MGTPTLPGVSPPMIARIEDALIDVIKSAPNLGYKLKGVESYGGQFDDDTFDVVRALPAAWVTFGGTQTPRAIETSRYAWKLPATFVVMVGTRNVRGERQTRHGGVSEVGTYQMIADVQALIVNRDFGLPCDYFKPGPVRTLFNTKVKGSALSVFAVEFHTAWIVRAAKPEELEGTGSLLKVGINYHLEPDDGVADATDVVSLQGA